MTIAWGQRAAVALERVNEILEVNPDVIDPTDPIELPRGDRSRGDRLGAVHFHDVDFGYDPTVPMLDGFELDLAAGQSVAHRRGDRIGQVDRRPAARAVLRRGTRLGVDRRCRRPRSARCTTSVTPSASCSRTPCSSTTPWRRTLPSPIPRPTADQIERAARLAGAHDFIMGLPEAYDTVLGERGFSLSGGQRQRIAIARAILADPRVLVLDDATSAVDPSKEHEIRAAMSTVMEGRTTIVIAHRPGTIALADTVVLLDEGRVIASGPHEELLAGEPRYREVLAAMEAANEPGLADTPADSAAAIDGAS